MPRRNNTENLMSAGGVVYRANGSGELEVAICGLRNPENWRLPKGTPDPGETVLQTSLREVREETGLTVELLGRQEQWGQVAVLYQPACILLEDIEPGHQHIDLIYFSRVISGHARVNPRESTQLRWCDHAALGDAAIAEDIRILGRRAIASIDAGEIVNCG